MTYNIILEVSGSWVQYQRELFAESVYDLEAIAKKIEAEFIIDTIEDADLISDDYFLSPRWARETWTGIHLDQPEEVHFYALPTDKDDGETREYESELMIRPTGIFWEKM